MKKHIAVLFVVLLMALPVLSCAAPDTEDLAPELDELQADMAALESEIQDLTDEIAEMAEAQADIAGLESELQDLTDEIEQLGELVENLENSVILAKIQEGGTLFNESTDFPVKFVGASYFATIDDANLNDQVDGIMSATVFLQVEDDIYQGILSIGDMVPSPDDLEDYRNGLLDTAEVGDYVVKVDWEENGSQFSTLAVVDTYGTPKYEPILMFTLSEIEYTQQDEWTPSGSYTTTRTGRLLGRNFLRKEFSVTLKWTVKCSDGKIVPGSEVFTPTQWCRDNWQIQVSTSSFAYSIPMDGWTMECKMLIINISWIGRLYGITIKQGFKVLNWSICCE